MQYLFTKENVTLFLSIASSIGALTSWFFTIYINKKRLIIKPIKSGYHCMFYIQLSLENRSRLPITITNVSLQLDKKLYKSFDNYFCVNEYTHRCGHDILDKKFDYNFRPPITTPALSAFAGFIVFELPKEVFESSPTPRYLLIESTRGKKQRILLTNNLPYNFISLSKTW